MFSSEAQEVVGEGECLAGTGTWRDTDSELATFAYNIRIAGTDFGVAQTRYESLPARLSTFGSSETAGGHIRCPLLASPLARSAIFCL